MLGNYPTVRDQDSIKILFKRFLKNQCNPDEIKELFELIQMREYEELFDSLIATELDLHTGELIETEQRNNALSRIKDVLLSEISAKDNASPTKPNLYNLIRRWRNVAALLLVIVSATLFVINRYLPGKSIFTNLQHTKYLATKNAQRKFIQLFDGTKIWLSPSSTIKFADQLVNNYREVTLDGEAFFEVAKDKIHPFIIHSGQMQTEVVGTSFNVKSYSKQNIYNVTVVTGIVRVSMLSVKKEMLSEVILRPKQQAILNNKQATLTDKSITAVDAVLKKKDGILSYDGIAVQEVVDDLRQYYNQSIELENKSTTCLCYGEFDTSKPIGIVLRQLAAAIGATVRQTDKGYFLQGGCRAAMNN